MKQFLLDLSRQVLRPIKKQCSTMGQFQFVGFVLYGRVEFASQLAEKFRVDIFRPRDKCPAGIIRRGIFAGLSCGVSQNLHLMTGKPYTFIFSYLLEYPWR